MFKIFKKIFKFLNSQADPVEIAMSAILGMFAAFLSPSLFNVTVIFLVALLLNCNFGIFVLCAGLFKIFTIIIDLVGDVIGKFVLTRAFLMPLWKTIAGIPILSLTDFNNSIIMGNFIVGIILTPIIWIITIKIVEYYRINLKNKVMKFKVMQILTGLDIMEGRQK